MKPFLTRQSLDYLSLSMIAPARQAPELREQQGMTSIDLAISIAYELQMRMEREHFMSLHGEDWLETFRPIEHDVEPRTAAVQ